MHAKALVCDEQQHSTIGDVTLREVGEGEVLIRTAYSGVSIGTEFALIRDRISWGPCPL